jgi:hypothetical protein
MAKKRNKSRHGEAKSIPLEINRMQLKIEISLHSESIVWQLILRRNLALSKEQLRRRKQASN